jgi:hypothetical protein
LKGWLAWRGNLSIKSYCSRKRSNEGKRKAEGSKVVEIKQDERTSELQCATSSVLLKNGPPAASAGSMIQKFRLK